MNENVLIKELFADSVALHATGQAGAGSPGIPVVAPCIDDPALPLRSPADKLLVGRERLLNHLQQLLLLTEAEPTALALYGMPGIGKTAIAVELARSGLVREHFRDGILWAGLGSQPNLLAHLSRWGGLLGLTAAELSACTTLDTMARMLRAAIGTRRLLLVLDDAWTVDESMAFQVGGPYCSYLLTTRFASIALHFAGTSAFQVSELSEEESLQLLMKLAPLAVAAEPEQARELVQAVGGLPLALTLLGKYLRSEAYSKQPRRLQEAFTQLHRRTTRLQLALPQSPFSGQANQPSRPCFSLSASIGASYAALSPRARSLLLALAAFPAKPTSFSEEAALTVASASPKTLDTLVDAGLLESCGAGRYMFHQTIADYARERGSNPRAEERLITFFTSFVQEHTADYPALEQETSCIQAALQLARDRGHMAAFVSGVMAFAPFLLAHGLYDTALSLLTVAYEGAQKQEDALNQMKTALLLGTALKECGAYAQSLSLFQEGLTLARKHGDDERCAICLLNLGTVVLNLGDSEQAQAYYREGLSIAQAIGNRQLICAFLSCLGVLANRQGEQGRATAYHHEGLAIARAIGHREHVSGFLQCLGVLAAQKGNFAQAHQHFQEALDLARAMDHRERMCAMLMNLGVLVLEQGDVCSAESHLLEGLTLARDMGHRPHLCLFLSYLAECAMHRGNYYQATCHIQEALALARELHHRRQTVIALRVQAELLLRQQRIEDAQTSLREALTLAGEKEHEEERARILYGLARCAATQNNSAAAYEYGQASLSILEALDNYRATDVRRWLTSLQQLA